MEMRLDENLCILSYGFLFSISLILLSHMSVVCRSMLLLSEHYKTSSIIRPPQKNCYVALSRPTVKCEKTGSGFFYIFFKCQIWAKNLLKFVFNGFKKHLHDLYMRFDCIPPEFSPFRNLKKNIGKLNSLTVRKKKKKKKKKKNPNRPTQFLNFGRVRAT